MANFQDKIRDTVLKAKNYIGCLAGNLVKRANAGDNIDCAQTKMLLLVNLVETLEFYYCFNFNDDGTITEPEWECLTYDEAQALVAKINILMK